MSGDFALNDYFDWLYFKVVRNNSYRRLFRTLHSIEFEYFVDYDENRAADGVNLRWYYVDDGGQDDILKWKRPCTVLEMLIGLALQMECITEDPDEDYSCAHWFWMMLDNLDLLDMTDDEFDKDYIFKRVEMFISRTYEPDGNGNIIYIQDCNDDLRTVEIWSQMCWYLDTIF